MTKCGEYSNSGANARNVSHKSESTTWGRSAQIKLQNAALYSMEFNIGLMIMSAYLMQKKVSSISDGKSSNASPSNAKDNATRHASRGFVAYISTMSTLLESRLQMVERRVTDVESATKAISSEQVAMRAEAESTKRDVDRWVHDFESKLTDARVQYEKIRGDVRGSDRWRTLTLVACLFFLWFLSLRA